MTYLMIGKRAQGTSIADLMHRPRQDFRLGKPDRANILCDSQSFARSALLSAEDCRGFAADFAASARLNRRGAGHDFWLRQGRFFHPYRPLFPAGGERCGAVARGRQSDHDVSTDMGHTRAGIPHNRNSSLHTVTYGYVWIELSPAGSWMSAQSPDPGCIDRWAS